MRPGESTAIPPLRQVAFVVRSLESSLDAYSTLLGIAPWSVYSLGAPRLQRMTYRGKAAEFRFRHALAVSGEVQFELVEPIAGPSIYADYLEKHGEGMQHMGTYVPDIHVATATLESRGFHLVQSGEGFGHSGDGAFAYFESPRIPTTIELIQAPAVRHEPDFVWPGPGPLPLPR